MTKIQKIILGIVAVITVMLLFAAIAPKNGGVGGVYNQVINEFRAGLKAGTSNQLVISSAGNITSTGSFTNSGSVSLGSITAGANYYRPVTALTSDTTVTVAQTGTVFNLGTAGVDVTLPAPTVANGVHYRFVVSAAFATTDITITVGNTDLIEGSLIVAGAVVACDAADTITIAAANEDIGDFIELYSNGVKWMIGANQAMNASNHACSG